MNTYIILFCLLFLFLSLQCAVSKSSTDTKYSNDGENSENIVKDAQLGSDENIAIHESYRPRHKYKTNGQQTNRFYRSITDTDKDQETKDVQCAVMYKNNEPVGILQPFEESYRFLPVNGNPTLVDINPIPVKRKTIMDVLYPTKITDDYDNYAADVNAQFTDDRYPSVFAKFKIDSRLDKSINPDLNLKRSMYKRGSEKNKINDEQVGSLKSTLAKRKSDDSTEVEEELKNILDDMGLIDDYSDKEEAKREAEDENLELGTNKINLLKEQKEKRDKRDDETVSIAEDYLQKDSTEKSSTDEQHKVEFERRSTDEVEKTDLFNSDTTANLKDSEHEVQESATDNELEHIDFRKKRQNIDNTIEEENKCSKRDVNILNAFDESTPNLIKESELNEYEKRVEREIKDKIQKLKEEVKKEIDDLKQKGSTQKEKTTEEPKRRKRQILNNLINEEFEDIDPTLNNEENNKIHIRRKRNIIFEDGSKTKFNKTSIKITARKNVPNSNVLLNSNQKQNFSSGYTANISYTPNGNLHAIQKYISINPFLRNFNKSVNKNHIRDLKQCNKNNISETLSYDSIKQVKNSTNILLRVVKENKINVTNPILENFNKSKYHIRTLKQYEDKINISESRYNPIKQQNNFTNQVLEEKNHKNGVNIRPKRQVSEESGEDTYQDDYSEFNNDDYENQKIDKKQSNTYEQNSAEKDKNENTYTSNTKNCNCDKNSNDCKCENQKSEINLPSFQPESSDYSANSFNRLERKSATQHCECDKNNNHCTCGKQFADALPMFKQDYSDYIEDQSNAIEKKSANLKDKESLNEFEFDSKIAMPKSIKERRNPTYSHKKDDFLPNIESNNPVKDEYEYYETNERNLQKREVEPRKLSVGQPFQNGEYFVDLHPDVYKLEPSENSREKRQDINDLIAIHGGGPTRSHLVAIRQRSMLPHSRFRRRVQKDDNEEPRQLIDMSDEDIFGALPQGFEGELARYKRIKRTGSASSLNTNT